MFMNKILFLNFIFLRFLMNSNVQYIQPLNVRNINIGDPNDPAGKNTIIGLLKGLIELLR